MKITKWNNIRGTFSVELAREKGKVYNTNDESVPITDLAEYVPDDGCELVIDFLSSGFHQPMSMFGGPDNLGWPEGSHDERLLDRAYIYLNGRENKLPPDVQEAAFDWYVDAIYETEIEQDEE